MPRSTDDDDNEDEAPVRIVGKRPKTHPQGVPVMPELWPEGPRESTGSHRAITPTDAEDLLRIQRRANALVAAEDRERDRDLTLAEWFGADWKGGKLAAMQTQLVEHKTRLDEQHGVLATLVEFKGRAMWLAGAALTIGGVIAAIAFKLIDHYWK